MPKKNITTTTMSTMAITKFSGVTTFNVFMKTCMLCCPMVMPINVARPITACIRRTTANTRIVTINFFSLSSYYFTYIS